MLVSVNATAGANADPERSGRAVFGIQPAASTFTFSARAESRAGACADATTVAVAMTTIAARMSVHARTGRCDVVRRSNVQSRSTGTPSVARARTCAAAENGPAGGT